MGDFVEQMGLHMEGFNDDQIKQIDAIRPDIEHLAGVLQVQMPAIIKLVGIINAELPRINRVVPVLHMAITQFNQHQKEIGT
jgi:hypothetical protein